jgi:hypothetical protein
MVETLAHFLQPFVSGQTWEGPPLFKSSISGEKRKPSRLERRETRKKEKKMRMEKTREGLKMSQDLYLLRNKHHRNRGLKQIRQSELNLGQETEGQETGGQETGIGRCLTLGDRTGDRDKEMFDFRR